MLSQRLLRMADEIIQNLDVSKVQEIIAGVNADPNTDPNDRDTTLVFNGVVLGVDQIQGYFLQSINDELAVFQKFVATVDEEIAQASTPETINALTKVREPVAELLNARIARMVGTRTAFFCQAFGIPEALIHDDTPPSELPENDLLMIGIEVYRRIPLSVLGWHYITTRKGTPKVAELRCQCPGCCGDFYNNKVKESRSVTLRHMVDSFNGLDDALRAFAMYLLDHVRSEIASTAQGTVTPMHSVTPGEPERIYKGFLTRLMQGGGDHGDSEHEDNE